MAKLYAFDLIKSGALKLDVLSDSTYYPLPLDHMDGKGLLAQPAAEVAACIPYCFAVGNMASCSSTDRAIFRAVYSDQDSVPGHDFDPQATEIEDRNTLAIEVKPWDGPNPTLLVALEWDGWPWQVKEDVNASWTRDDVIRVQDVDLAVYYQSTTGNITRIGVSDYNQFGGPGVPPVEYVKKEITTPGTYLIQVANVSDQHSIPGVFTRPVEFHVCVYLQGGIRLRALHIGRILCQHSGGGKRGDRRRGRLDELRLVCDALFRPGSNPGWPAQARACRP